MQATTISLNPVSQRVALGNQVSPPLNMYFSVDAALGVGVDILYSSSPLSFVSFVFNPGLSDDSGMDTQAPQR